jgi:transposase
MTPCNEMPVRALASLIAEHDTRVWRVVHHYVEAARAAQELSGVRRVGLDETSFRRGQDCVSVFAYLDRPRAIFATPGRDQSVVERFAEDLEAHGGGAEQVTEICQDMSEAFLAGTLKHLPEAEITFDRYHVKAHAQ